MDVSISKEEKKTYSLLLARLDAVRAAKVGNISEAIATLRVALCSKYPDARNYILFSLLAGAAVPEGTGPFDFPQADSIERFVNEKYMSAFPDYVLFSLLAKAEAAGDQGASGFQLPESVSAYIDNQYASTFPKPADCLPGDSEENALNWLQQPLRLDPGVPLSATKPKTVVPSGHGEHPFHAQLPEPPAPPPKKKRGLKWLKHRYFRSRDDLSEHH